HRRAISRSGGSTATRSPTTPRARASRGPKPSAGSRPIWATSPRPEMTEAFRVLLAELERFGAANDGATAARPQRMLNITRDTGELLSVLVRATAAQHVLEIGTSNGYSTLWLASAARAAGGSVTTVELADYKVELARENFRRSGLAEHITMIQGDAGKVLE